MRFVRGKLVVLCAILVGAVAFVAAQGPPAGRGGGRGGRGGRPLQNVTVLPSDWSGQQMRQLMQTFVESLGVAPPNGEGCGHCHTVDPDAPAPEAGRGPSYDWALDDNEKKDVVRQMIQMTMALNAEHLDSVGDVATKEKVTCFTCHQGRDKPLVAPADGWARGNFTLIPPGPTVPQRGGGGRGGDRGN